MARFKQGQHVSFGGKEGVVEDVDLTPGMVDVRYGRLVKRHSAEDLVHAARENSGRRRRRKPRQRRRARWNPDLPAVPADRLVELKAELEQVLADRARLISQAHSLEGAGKGPPRTPTAGTPDRRGSPERQEEARRERAVRGLSYMRATDAEGRTLPGSPEWEEVTKNAARLHLLGLNLQDRIHRLERGLPEVEPPPVRRELTPEQQEEYDDARAQRSRADTGGRKLKVAKGRPPKRKQQVGAERGKITSLQVKGGKFLTLPDPPRFPKSRSGKRYIDELCGNPLDGTLYVLAMPQQTRWIHHTVTNADAQEVLGLALTKDLDETTFWSDPAAVRRNFKLLMERQGFTDLQEKGTDWMSNEEGVSTIVPFTAADVAQIRLGVMPSAQFSRIKKAKGRTGAGKPQAKDLSEENMKRRDPLFTPGLLPTNTFFWKRPESLGGGYTAFIFSTRKGLELERLQTKFQPPLPFAKRKSPFFSWQRLYRPIVPTQAGFREPVCLTEEGEKAGKAARTAADQVGQLLRRLRGMSHALNESETWPTRKLRSFLRSGDAALGALAWFASGMQDIISTLQFAPEKRQAHPEAEVFSVFAAAFEGLGLEAVVRTIADLPVPLAVRNPHRFARVLGGDSIRAADEDTVFPQRFVAVPFATLPDATSPSAARLQESIDSAQGDIAAKEAEAAREHKKGNRAEASRLRAEARDMEEAQSLIPRRFRGAIISKQAGSLLPLLKGRGPARLATFIAEKQLRTGLLPSAGLSGEERFEAFKAASGKIHEQIKHLGCLQREKETDDAFAFRMEKKFGSQYRQKCDLLLGLAYIFYSVGGPDLIAALVQAQTILGYTTRGRGHAASAEVPGLLRQRSELKAQLEAVKDSAATRLNRADAALKRIKQEMDKAVFGHGTPRILSMRRGAMGEGEAWAVLRKQQRLDSGRERYLQRSRGSTWADGEVREGTKMWSDLWSQGRYPTRASDRTSPDQVVWIPGHNSEMWRWMETTPAMMRAQPELQRLEVKRAAILAEREAAAQALASATAELEGGRGGLGTRVDTAAKDLAVIDRKITDLLTQQTTWERAVNDPAALHERMKAMPAAATVQGTQAFAARKLAATQTKLKEEGRRRKQAEKRLDFARRRAETTTATTGLGQVRRRLGELIQGQSLSLAGGVSYFFTFNPVLFMITKAWWGRGGGGPWAKTKVSKTEFNYSPAVVQRAQDVNTVGRYGESLRLVYERALSRYPGGRQVDLEEMQNQLAGHLRSSRALAQFEEYRKIELKHGVGSTDDRELAAIGDLRSELDKNKSYHNLRLIDRLGPALGYHPGVDVVYEAADLVNDPAGQLTEMRQEAQDASLAYASEGSRLDRLATAARGTKLAASGEHGQTAANIQELAVFPGIGKKTIAKLRRAGINTVQRLRMATDAQLRALKLQAPQLRAVRHARALAGESLQGAEWAPAGSDGGSMEPLDLTMERPYKRYRRGSAEREPSLYPRDSALAALEYLETDSTLLQRLIKRRKKQLGLD
jgi:hypothetical protein